MINFKPLLNNYEYFQIVKPLGNSITLKAGETVKAEVIDVLSTGGVVLRIKGGILTVNTEIPLQKNTSLLLKILNTPQTDHKLKIQLIGILNKNEALINPKTEYLAEEIINFLQTGKNRETILNSIFSYIVQNINNSDTKAQRLAQNLLNSFLSSQKINLQINNTDISKILHSIKEVSPETFEKIIKNSGLFFENKIKHKKFSEIKDDLKYVLLNRKDLTQNEKQVLTGIEGYQLLSKAFESVYIFLPLLWDDLERGDILLKKSKKWKNVYFCRINLDFKDLGRFSGGIFQFGRELYLNFFVENLQLKELIRKNSEELIQNIKKHGFSEVSLRFLKNPVDDLKLIDENLMSDRV